jgi:very-short-patch-repair endonuclease
VRDAVAPHPGSKGELECEDVLKKWELTFEREYTIDSLPRRHFDFMFIYNQGKYLLEFDGIQHFQQQEYFSDTEEKLKKRQQRDLQKSRHALANGYYLIRIEHTKLFHIEAYLHQALLALKGKFKAYYSNTEMYNYLLAELSPPTIQFLLQV